MVLFRDDADPLRRRLRGDLGPTGGIAGLLGLGRTADGSLSQAGKRLGPEPVRRDIRPGRGRLRRWIRWALLEKWAMMGIDGMEWEAPDTAASAAEFGYPGTGDGERAAFPKARVVDRRARVARAGAGHDRPVHFQRQRRTVLTRQFDLRLEPDWLIMADRRL